MSKKKNQKKAAVIVLALIACLALAALTVSTLKNRQIRDRIDSRYSSVQMPGWLYLSQKKYYGDHSYWDAPAAENIKQNWTYDYLPIAKEVPLEEMCNIIAKSLSSAGYSVIETNADMNKKYASSHGYVTLHATGKDLNLIVDISVYPTHDGSASTSIVQDVGVQAYE
jgi:hypothetical protein